eukprot:3736365-Rhodomonas_salina.1
MSGATCAGKGGKKRGRKKKRPLSDASVGRADASAAAVPAAPVLRHGHQHPRRDPPTRLRRKPHAVCTTRTFCFLKAGVWSLGMGSGGCGVLWLPRVAARSVLQRYPRDIDVEDVRCQPLPQIAAHSSVLSTC